jgi:hypothetical protein
LGAEPDDIPGSSPRDGRFLTKGAPYEVHAAIDRRVAPGPDDLGLTAAKIETVRFLRLRQFGSEPSVDPSALRREVAVSRWTVGRRTEAVVATDPAFLEDRGLPLDIVGDPSRDSDFRPWQELFSEIRQWWSGLVVMPSAALPGHATLLVPARELKRGAVTVEPASPPTAWIDDDVIARALQLRTEWDARHGAEL